MKKLLGLLAVIAIVPSSAIATVSCVSDQNQETNQELSQVNYSEIEDVLNEIANQTFTSKDEANSEVISRLKNNEQIDTTIFKWIGSDITKNQEKYQVDVTYRRGYSGQAVFTSYVQIASSSQANVSSVISDIAEMYFESKATAEPQITFLIDQVVGVASSKIIWDETQTYTIELTYDNNYTGPSIQTGTIKLKTNQNSLIQNTLDELSNTYFENKQVAENDIRESLVSLSGITVNDVKWLNETSLRPSYAVSVNYDNASSGDTSFTSVVRIAENIDSQINKYLNAVNNRYFDNAILANMVLNNALNQVKGIDQYSTNWEENTYSVNLTLSTGYTGTTKFTGTINLRTGISQNVFAVLKNINGQYFDDVEQATAKIKEEMSKVEHAWIVGDILWDDLNYSFRVEYDNEYYGNTIFSGSILLAKDITENINEILTNVDAKYFNSKEEVVSKIVSNLQNAKLDGDVVWNGNSFSFDVIYDYGYQGQKTFSRTIEGINTNINSEIQAKLTAIKNIAFDSASDAINSIKSRIGEIEGVASVDVSGDLTLTENSETKFTLTLSYDDGYTGNANFDGEIGGVKVEINKNDLINAAIDKISNSYFDTNEEFANALKQEVELIEGVSVNGEISWKDSQFTMKVEYGKWSKGDTSFIGSVKLRKNITNEINEIINNHSSQYYNKTSDFQETLSTQLNAINGVDSATVDVKEDNTFTVSLTYKNEYQGILTYEGTIKINENLNKKINSLLLSFNKTYYDDALVAESAIRIELNKIVGITANNFTWNGMSYKVNVEYQTGYTGDTTFNQSVLFNKNISTDIQESISGFKEKYYNNDKTGRDDAQQDIITSLNNLEGISDANNFTWTDETNGKFSVDLAYENGFTGISNISGEIKFNVNLNQAIKDALAKLDNLFFDTTDLAAAKIQEELLKITGVEISTEITWNSNKYVFNVTYSTGYNGDTSFNGEVKINQNLNQTINDLLDKFENNYYYNSTQASEAIKAELKTLSDQFTIDGDLIWNENSYTFNVSYKPGYTGNESFTNTVLFKTNLTNIIKTALASLTSDDKYFDDKTQVTSEITSIISGIDGVSMGENSLIWDGNTYTITVAYENAYTGETSYSGTIKLNQNINDDINKVISEISAKYYDNTADAAADIKNLILNVDGVNEVSSISWDETNKNSYNIALTYDNGYTGENSFNGTVGINTNITVAVTSTLATFANQYFNTEDEAKTAISDALSKITGIASITNITFDGNQFNVELTHAIGYNGQTTYSNNQFKGFRNNLNEEISSLKNTFESKVYNQYQLDNVKNDVESLLDGVAGIASKIVGVSGNDIEISLTYEEAYTGASEFKWTVNRQDSVLGSITDQSLSFKTNKLSSTVDVVGTNLTSLNLGVKSDDSALNVSINGTTITYTTTTNVTGSKTYTVEVYDLDHPELTTTFKVVVEGKPEFGEVVTQLPNIIDIRKGNDYIVEFTMNYMDPTMISSLTAGIPSNKLDNSYIRYDEASELYQLIIHGENSNYDDEAGDVQDVSINLDGVEIWTHSTKVWEYPKNIIIDPSFPSKGDYKNGILVANDGNDAYKFTSEHKSISFEIKLDGLVDDDDQLLVYSTNKEQKTYNDILSNDLKDEFVRVSSTKIPGTNVWTITITAIKKQDKLLWNVTDQYVTVWLVNKNSSKNINPKKIFTRNTDVDSI